MMNLPPERNYPRAYASAVLCRLCICAHHGLFLRLSCLPRPVRPLLFVDIFRMLDLFHLSTNQTTLEHISPFYILRYLPPLPPSRLSSPPLEHQLASKQRRAVRAAHARMRLYDVGWRRNVEQVYGMGAKRRWQAWAGRLLWGGGWYVRCLFISAPLLPLILAPLWMRPFFKSWCRDTVSAQPSCGGRTRGAGGGVDPVRNGLTAL